MKSIKLLLTVLAISVLSCNSNAQNKMVQTENVKYFVSKFANFKMDIQGAGMATIPKATLSDKEELYIEYAYHSEGENRKGKMTLLINDSKEKFVGNWKTIADNGNVYQGSLYFVFKQNGEADGYYKYAGSDYKITIFIPKK